MTQGIKAMLMLAGLWSGIGLGLTPLHASQPDEVRTHAEESFDALPRQAVSPRTVKPAPRVSDISEETIDGYSPDRYWIGKGQGDMAKGKIVCQRVSELSARTDLAKQIRVMVKEHMVDRLRERSGRDSEQDIELTREELVQEYLQGVKIIDRRIDEENKLCTATAVMLKTPLRPGQDAETGRRSLSPP